VRAAATGAADFATIGQPFGRSAERNCFGEISLVPTHGAPDLVSATACRFRLLSAELGS
jgi:hypothetical protein